MLFAINREKWIVPTLFLFLFSNSGLFQITISLLEKRHKSHKHKCVIISNYIYYFAIIKSPFISVYPPTFTLFLHQEMDIRYKYFQHKYCWIYTTKIFTFYNIYVKKDQIEKYEERINNLQTSSRSLPFFFLSKEISCFASFSVII